jgi:hypothetical protein
VWRIVVYRGAVSAAVWEKSLGKEQHGGWYSRSCLSSLRVRHVFFESRCLGMQRKVGGKFHLKLNIGARPIANKYREGKMKRTLKRELKSTWNCWKGTESFPVSIIRSIFHWRVDACSVNDSGLLRLALFCVYLLVPCVAVGRQSQFVCCGKWSVEEVGALALLYLDWLVVVVGTEVPTTCFKVLRVLIRSTAWIACYVCGCIGWLCL